MLKFVKKLLFKLMPIEAYLRLVSSLYIKLISAGFLKKQYPEIHYLRTLIKPGFNCIDIGANLGYYSVFMSRWATPAGKVIAVEPMPLFGKIWQGNMLMNRCTNITLVPNALGSENKTVRMTTPVIDGVLRHGLTKVSDTNKDSDTTAQSIDVQMITPTQAFATLQKIDFIKIDVEGYEQYIIKEMLPLINTHKPIVQAELSGDENRTNVLAMLHELKYELYILANDALAPIPYADATNYDCDFYFKHPYGIGYN
jgi:FkbM family methyltransferase